MRIASEPGARAGADVIPLSEPCIGGNAWEYVKQCLDSGWVSSAGQFVTRFEDACAARLGMRHAVATSSGTAALHVGLIVAGVQPEDEVVVPALTFIAPANAVRYVGAWPVFVDVEPEYWQLDPQRLADFLAKECVLRDGALRNRQSGRRVSAVLPVDLLGHPAEMNAIAAIAERYELAVVEDATESLGARYHGEPVGSHADVTCLSFNGNKVITSGGGGMIVTNSSERATRAKYLTTQAKDDPVEYVHRAIGFNYRLTNLQAALGVAQLEQLDEHVAAKRRIAATYAAAFAALDGVTTMREAPAAASSFWLSTVLIDDQVFPTDSRGLLRALAAAQIQSRPLWQPLQLSVAHAGAQHVGGEHATRIHAHALSLPSSVGLSSDDQERVIARVRETAGA
jgi:perosamine synthetase